MNSGKVSNLSQRTPPSAIGSISSTRANTPLRNSRSAWLHRRGGKAAIAGEHRGDAVEAAHRRIRIESDLRVIMRVGIDDAGSDDAPVRVDLLCRGGVLQPGEPGDAAVLDADVDPPARQAGAVDEHAAPHDKVIFHAALPSFSLASMPIGAKIVLHGPLRRRRPCQSRTHLLGRLPAAQIRRSRAEVGAGRAGRRA